jgi:K+-sensing histidine kinase KdpD
MRLSANNKMVAIMLCVALLVALLAGYYFLYLRHRLRHRYGLEQVLEINRRALTVPAYQQEEVSGFVQGLVDGLFKEMNELVALDEWGIAVYSEEVHGLCYAFSDSDEGEELKEEMLRCFESEKLVWMPERKLWFLPLCVEAGGESRCVGVMALHCASHTGQEDRLMLELVAGYVAIIVYNAMELVAQKYRDIDWARDEARRVVREENLLHVQNMVLDNCLSTIKHETIYYPNRIKQILDRLHEGLSEEEERQQVETISELIGYYKDVFTILSSCASRQLEEVTFRRSEVKASDLAEGATKYFRRVIKKSSSRLELNVKADSLTMTGDAVLLRYLLENLINEAMTYTGDGVLELQIYKEGAFVRFDFIDRRRNYSQDELNQLFYPHLSRMQHAQEGVLAGTEYLVCKQIIRDHDEFAGRRGCRMNACVAEGGGFMVWFTIPAR